MLYEQAPAEPGFRELFRGSQNRQGLCVLAVMAWIASADGRISARERELLRSIAEANEEDTAELSAALKMATAGRAEDLEVACRFLRSETSRGEKRVLAQLAIAMAVQDGQLTVGENHVLQFLADLLGFSPRAFSRLFERTTGRLFPQAGDPSSRKWWKQRDAGLEAAPPEDGWRINSSTREAPELNKPAPMTRGEALSVLGLGEGATRDMIHAAYRRLAKKRHPDRFASFGRAAVSTATLAFERLREAYNLLSSGAAQAVAAAPFRASRNATNKPYPGTTQRASAREQEKAPPARKVHS